jgi:hypothetical protein
MALVASRLSLLARPSDSVIPTVQGLRCWLRADRIHQQNGASVARWEDQSGFGNHAVNPTVWGHSTPTFNAFSALNSLPGLTFNGAGAAASGLQTPIGQYVSGNDVPYTLFIALRVLSADTGNITLWGFDAGNAQIGSFERSTAGGTIRAVRDDDASVSAGGTTACNIPTTTNVTLAERFGRTAALYEIFDRGTLEDSFTINVGTMTITYCQIGGYDNYSCHMTISEVAFFNRALTDTEFHHVNRDIGARWGIAVA